MSSVMYQNKKDGRTQTFDEREKTRASILERNGWFRVQAEPERTTVTDGGAPVPVVMSETNAVPESDIDDFTQIAGVGYDLNDALHAAGFRNLADLANADVDKLLAVNGVGKATAAKLRTSAAKIRLEVSE